MIRNLETLLNSIQSFIREDVGGGITRLNKCINNYNIINGDTLLDTIPNNDNRYVYNQSDKTGVMNNIWVDIGIGMEERGESDVKINGNSYSINTDIYMEVVFFDNLQNDEWKKGLRYADIMLNLITEFSYHRDELGCFNDAKIYTTPVLFGEKTCLACGVKVKIDFAK